MTILRLILADHLTRDIAALRDLDPATDRVLMLEPEEEWTYVPHHKQKIAFQLSAMRHFAADLAAEGIPLDYVRLTDPDNTQTLGTEIARAVARHHASRLIVTAPGDWRVAAMLRDLSGRLGCPVTLLEDDRFVCSRERFARWAGTRRQWRMEFFYREMRRLTGFLMAGDTPEGGQWNFDRDNRARLPSDMPVPPPLRFAPDAITAEVLALVGTRFAQHFGDLTPFGWGVTRADALAALTRFIDRSLPYFGDFQDAMKRGEDVLFHSVISPYLNCGLLTPREICAAAERSYYAGDAPLNAVEGFIRQIIGWREYVRGIYWARMPDYAQTNFLGASRPLPSFFWTGDTDMACIADVVSATRRTAYAHHIQRLMVTGNFALLAGIAPHEVEAWYLIVYADAWDWVELPNVHGMVLHADGGLLGSKPYAASGAYIDRMSDYCAGCRYDPKVKSGPNACPFNPLYWDFLIRNEKQLGRNPRLAMPYRTLAAMSPARRAEIVADAAAVLGRLR